MYKHGPFISYSIFIDFTDEIPREIYKLTNIFYLTLVNHFKCWLLQSMNKDLKIKVSTMCACERQRKGLDRHRVRNRTIEMFREQTSLIFVLDCVYKASILTPVLSSHFVFISLGVNTPSSAQRQPLALCSEDHRVCQELIKQGLARVKCFNLCTLWAVPKTFKYSTIYSCNLLDLFKLTLFQNKFSLDMHNF